MRIIDVQTIGWDDVRARLQDVRLLNDASVKPYEHARIKLRQDVSTDDMDPAQRYALEPNLAQVEALVDALAAAGHDLFALGCGLTIRTDAEPEVPRSVIPPILERGTFRDDGRPALILADGIHRAFVARSRGRRMTAIVVEGVASHVPYYAWPEPKGWDAVQVKSFLEEGFQKKDYRVKVGYQKLFRNFNAAFPGVQPDRDLTHPPGFTP